MHVHLPHKSRVGLQVPCVNQSVAHHEVDEDYVGRNKTVLHKAVSLRCVDGDEIGGVGEVHAAQDSCRHQSVDWPKEKVHRVPTLPKE